jgi:starch synthase (maltosyl-transferring)
LLAATLSSNYGLYGPVYEFLYHTPTPGKEEYYHNEKYEIKHWEWNTETRLQEIITLVNRIRKENPALQNTYNIEFAETTNEHIICFVKKDAATGNVIITVINLDAYHTQSAEVFLPSSCAPFPEQYTVCDLLSGDKFRWQADRNFVQLNPYEMPGHILLADLPKPSRNL